jgi:deoxyhypusine synthase
MYCHCDVTAVFPWLTYALLSDPRVHKKHRRLYDSRAKAVKTLQGEIEKRRTKLLETVKFDLPKKKVAKKK